MYDHNEAKKRESERRIREWEEGLNRLSKERINRSETKKEKERRIETQIDEFAQEERKREEDKRVGRRIKQIKQGKNK